MSNKCNLNTFNWQQLFNDSKGKTSPSLVLGFFGGVVAIVVFLLCGISILTKYQDGANVQTMAMQSVAMLTVCAALLGIRRFTKDKEIETI
jgi:Co/Zn/Cd efflux system component